MALIMGRDTSKKPPMDAIFDALFTMLQISTENGSVGANGIFQAPLRPWDSPKPLSTQRTIKPLGDREWLQLEVSDFSSNACLCVPNTSVFGLEFTTEDIKAFSSKPLSPIDLDKYTESAARINDTQGRVLETLPFSLEKHRQVRYAYTLY
jgi:hypothetical protein